MIGCNYKLFSTNILTESGDGVIQSTIPHDWQDIFFHRNIIPSKWNTRKNVPCSIIFHLIWINPGCKIIYSLRRIHYCREIRARLLLQIILHFCLGWLIWHKIAGQRLVVDPKSLPMVINVSVGLIKDHMNIYLISLCTHYFIYLTCYSTSHSSLSIALSNDTSLLSIVSQYHIKFHLEYSSGRL